jgi:uncharacterized protein (TIGR01319 family)
VNSPALLIDFGSTFTKVTAVDLDEARIVGRGQAPSTVETDVGEGLLHALERLRQSDAIFGDEPMGLDALGGRHVRACSSAAGGLRIVVAGLVPGLTVEAANAAALGAGGKVVGAFGFKLGEDDIGEIAGLKPDMILLTGGTDGGDTQTILHNAAMLARTALPVPFVVAGNAAVSAEVSETIATAGKEVSCADNVMAAMNKLSPASAQKEIRRLFMRRIVDGKGLERIKARVPVVLPTPLAVLKAAFLGSQGTRQEPGRGDLVLVDVGGATTDVYSIGEGKQRGKDIIPRGLPEPFAKRTVEGDLGLRFNATTILNRVGADALYAEFQAAFPALRIPCADLLAYVEAISEETGRVPAEDWQFAADAVMARIAVDLAIERHAGRREPYHSSGGTVFLRSGKDLTKISTLIGTGGIFTYNPYADRILAAGAGTGANGRYEVLRPADPRILLDRDYVLYAIGLLADSHPMVALRIFRHHFASERRQTPGRT